jgi:cyclic pyranopterin phosphate synthase
LVSPKEQTSLTAGEIESLVGHLVQHHGLKKVRLTGGEPTARPDLIEIVGRLAKIEGLSELAMTTYGLTLAKDAAALKKAGLMRVNISLDSLDPEKYQRITGVDGLRQALAGINAAIAAGLTPVKLNAVVVRGENNHDLSDLLLYAVDKGVEIRFIELMPMGPLARNWQQRFVPEAEMRQQLADVVTTWRPNRLGPNPAREYRAGLTYGRRARVGFVTAMTCPFCDACNRIRIAADGTYYPCLMDRPAGNLLAALRPKFDADLLDELLEQGVAQKAREHPPTSAGIMTHIGG